MTPEEYAKARTRLTEIVTDFVESLPLGAACCPTCQRPYTSLSRIRACGLCALRGCDACYPATHAHDLAHADPMTIGYQLYHLTEQSPPVDTEA